jgi:basic membrane protein A and related proteins
MTEEDGPVTNRLRLFAIAACALLLVVASATRSTPATGQPEAATPSASQAAKATPLASQFDLTPHIAVVYDQGGLDAGGIDELARTGIRRAADELVAELTEVSGRPDDTDADREERLRLLADAGFYPIFAVGSSYAGPVARIASTHRGTWFGIVDDATVEAPNVIGITFSVGQGAFLVGAAAALTSRTGKVGFVATEGTPQLQKLEAGFTAGAKAARPDVRVQVAYLSQPGDAGSSEPDAATEAASAMVDAGADVIFAADGGSAGGVIQAAHDRGVWAIGVDTDQYRTADPSARGAILTSMLKRADIGAYTIAMEIARGVPKDGNNVFGLDRDGVGYSTSGGFLDPIQAQLDDFAARIAAGQIVVPSAP